MNFSHLFTASPGIFFLNAGTRSKTLLSALSAIEKYVRDDEENPTKGFYTSYPKLWETQMRMSKFLGCDPKEFYFRPNVTEALGHFLFSLSLPSSGEILVTEWEYGATSEMAKLRAQQSGLGFRVIPLPLDPPLSRGDLIQRIVSALRPESRVLVMSHVATSLGVILPMEEIAREAHKRGIITIIDGAHAAGSLELSQAFSDNIDFYGGNLHKWFMGPRGTAFGWVHPRWRGKLDWKFGGWASFGFPSFYQNFGDGDEETARRLIPGTFDSSPFFALNEVLDFWEMYGVNAIRAHQKSQLQKVIQAATKIGLERVGPTDAELQGPLVAFKVPFRWKREEDKMLATEIYYDAKVQLAVPKASGQDVVRFSPGIYTTEQEILGAFEALARFRT